MAATWVRRTTAARAVAAALVATPVLAGTAAGLIGSRLWSARSWPGGTTARMLALAVVGATVAALAARLTRRALPLVHLLCLTLTFPDRAPSRVGIALRANRAHHLRRAVEQGRPLPPGTPQQEATRLLTLIGWLTIHDRRTRGHGDRVCAIAGLLADALGLPDRDRDQLAWAAVLHDVGKIAVPAAILNKAGPLDDAERACVQRHTIVGHELTAGLADWLGPYRLVPLEHHERMDGKGYPYGTAATAISFGARLVAVADVLDVLTTARPYQRARTWDEARAELVAESGRQFDPDVVAAALRCGLGPERVAHVAGGALGGGATGLVRWLVPSGLPAPMGTAVVAVGLATAAIAAATAVGRTEPMVTVTAGAGEQATGRGAPAPAGRAGWDGEPGQPESSAAPGDVGPTEPSAGAPTSTPSTYTPPTTSTTSTTSTTDSAEASPRPGLPAATSAPPGQAAAPSSSSTPTGTTAVAAPPVPVGTTTTSALLAVSLPATVPVVGTLPIVGTLPPVSVTVSVPAAVGAVTTLPVVSTASTVLASAVSSASTAVATVVSTVTAVSTGGAVSTSLPSLPSAPLLPTVPTAVRAIPDGTPTGRSRA